MKKLSIEFTEEQLSITENLRLDKYLAICFPEFSRSFLQKLCKEEKVWVNGRNVKVSFTPSYGDQISFEVPDTLIPDIEPEDIPLDIVYEDKDVILVNKPKGMVVHPAAGHNSGTLVNALMYHCPDSLSGINGVMRPGIVHRIDKDTTGLIIACKNDTAHKSLAEQLKVHSVVRRYHAIVQGNLKDDEGVIDAPIGRDPSNRLRMAVNYQNGKHAVTHYRVLKRLKGYTYVECVLETGRTHQIRVHMKSLGHPLLGDELYGQHDNKIKNLQGQTLHAKVFGFVHPSSGEQMIFDSELPDYFKALLERLA